MSDVSFHWYRTIGQTLMSRPAYSFFHSCFKGILDQENCRPLEPRSLEGANVIPFRCIWWRKTLSLRAKTIGKKNQFFLARGHFTLCKYCDNPSTAAEEILSQPLWLNSEIKIGGKPVLNVYQHWAKADVFLAHLATGHVSFCHG